MTYVSFQYTGSATGTLRISGQKKKSGVTQISFFIESKTTIVSEFSDLKIV